MPSKRTRYISPGIHNPELIWILGITALIALGILEQLEAQGLTRPLDEMAHNSTEYLHTLIEALRSVMDTLLSLSCPD